MHFSGSWMIHERIVVAVTVQFGGRNVKTEAFGTKRDVIDGNVFVESYSSSNIKV